MAPCWIVYQGLLRLIFLQITCKKPKHFSFPPCSPARVLPIPAEVEHNPLQLTAYPVFGPDTRQGFEFSLPPDQGPDDREDCFTFANVADFVRTSLVPYSEHFDNVYKHLLEIMSRIDDLQKASVSNDNIFGEKFTELWRTLSNVSRVLDGGLKDCAGDISRNRDNFNELVGKHLPESFGIVYQNMQERFAHYDKSVLDSEARFQEIFPLLQQNTAYGHQLYEHMQGLVQNIQLLQAQVAHLTGFPGSSGDVTQILELSILTKSLQENIQQHSAELLRVADTCQNFSQLFVPRKQYDLLEERLTTLEKVCAYSRNFQLGVQDSLQQLKNTFQGHTQSSSLAFEKLRHDSVRVDM